MSFFAAVCILMLIIPEWLYGTIAGLLFFPFFAMIVLVERFQAKHGMIGPESDAEAAE